ncbi:hypothetical protein FQN54_008887 [Arachnomyces sp. PD_36]|nr:hypothetical protein FQN54_008887 [Arachnomyces sp. PD_36]
MGQLNFLPNVGVFVLAPAGAFLRRRLETLAFEALNSELPEQKIRIAAARDQQNVNGSGRFVRNKVLDDVVYNLREAAKCGYMPCVKLILESIPWLHETSICDLAHDIVAKGKPEILKLLLDQDWILSDIERTDDNGDTALGIAARAKNYANMEVLLDYGARTDISPGSEEFGFVRPGEKDDGRLLTYATQNRDKKMLKLWLERGLKPEWEEDWLLEIPLCIALDNYDMEIVNMLLEHGANLNSGEEQPRKLPLSQAIEGYDLDVIEKLIDLGAKLNAPDDDHPDALCTAIAAGRQDVFTFLLAKGAFLAPLHLMYTVGRSIPIAKQILDKVEIDYATPALFKACEDGDKEFLKLLIDRGVKPINPFHRLRRQNALEIATECGHTEIVEMLTKAGAKL